MLAVLGTYWAVFVVGTHLSDPVSLLMESAFVVAPFFLLAWTAGRWPRVTGALLLAVGMIVFWWVFDLGRQFVEWPSQVLTFVLLLVPMVACGLALIREGGSHDD